MATHKKGENQYKIPIRQITTAKNNRYALSTELAEMGYGAYGVFPEGPENPDKDVWNMARSDDPAVRAEYYNLISQHDDDLFELYQTILAHGLLQPIRVVDNGRKKGSDNTYTLVYGFRRTLAVLMGYCSGQVKNPMIEASFTKARGEDRISMTIIENMARKQMNPIEEARAIKRRINAGAEVTEVADTIGITQQTVYRRLKLLELPDTKQRKIAEGKLSATKALEEKRKPRESTRLEQKYVMMPKREIIDWYESTSDPDEKRVLGVVLGYPDDEENQ